MFSKSTAAKFLLGVGLVGGCAYGYINTAYMDVAVLTRNLEAGSLIEFQDLKTISVKKTENSKLAIQNPAEMVGKIAANEIIRETLVYEFNLSDGKVATPDLEDMVIVPVKLDYLNVPGSLNVNDLVNVVAHFDDTQIDMTKPFNITFSEVGVVKNVKYDDYGFVIGADLMLPKGIASEVSMASADGSLTIIKTYTDDNLYNGGVSVERLLNKYFAEGKEGLMKPAETPTPEVPMIEE